MDVGVYKRTSIRNATAVGAELVTRLWEDLEGGRGTVYATCAVYLQDGVLMYPKYWKTDGGRDGVHRKGAAERLEYFAMRFL